MKILFAMTSIYLKDGLNKNQMHSSKYIKAIQDINYAKQIIEFHVPGYR